MALEGRFSMGDATHVLGQIGFRLMGLSENSVPLNPMVNDHYPY